MRLAAALSSPSLGAGAPSLARAERDTRVELSTGLRDIPHRSAQRVFKHSELSRPKIVWLLPKV